MTLKPAHEKTRFVGGPSAKTSRPALPSGVHAPPTLCLRLCPCLCPRRTRSLPAGTAAAGCRVCSCPCKQPEAPGQHRLECQSARAAARVRCCNASGNSSPRRPGRPTSVQGAKLQAGCPLARRRLQGTEIIQDAVGGTAVIEKLRSLHGSDGGHLQAMVAAHSRQQRHRTNHRSRLRPPNRPHRGRAGC